LIKKTLILKKNNNDNKLHKHKLVSTRHFVTTTFFFFSLSLVHSKPATGVIGTIVVLHMSFKGKYWYNNVFLTKKKKLNSSLYNLKLVYVKIKIL